MRKVELEEQYKLKAKDMFHIPLDKRGLVKTQRFSVPGYPCLYLAHTVYGCWEEMGRPFFGTTMVSRFESKMSFKVLDLRIPTKVMWNDNLTKCILFFPLVIACMIQVQNVTDSYKPEYLIPQLLTEWVITHNREMLDPTQEEILGIVYTSAHKNDDFKYPLDNYDNYAIPVLKPLSGGKYCTRLTSLFKLTPPRYYDCEVLKRGEGINIMELISTEGEKLSFHDMKKTRFGEMERFHKDVELISIDKDGGNY